MPAADRPAYGSPGAFRRALTDKLRAMAAATGPWSMADLQRQFAYDRLLVRLYPLDDGWILKGSTALLARHIAVRHTIDVDVYRAVGREQAERDLRAALLLDAGDWFTFDVGRGRQIADGVSGTRVFVDARIGTTTWAKFHVDVVADGVRMTGDPDDVPALTALGLPGLPPRSDLFSIRCLVARHEGPGGRSGGPGCSRASPAGGDQGRGKLGAVNRLGNATSPYLLQHAENPVDWWEWGPEAFAEARRRDVPVLISVGYAACHWCHVMAHESFEHDGVAARVNATVVAIKVDREERPDVDAVYMTATQAMTGQGGWPMTVFADPDGVPFFAGTYYRRADFLRLVESVSSAWRDQREAVLEQGAAVVEAIGRSQGGFETVPGSVTPELLDSAARSLRESYDPTHGGFGGAPKFPPHLAMLFLLRHYQRTGDEESLEIVRHTAEAMARGGIYDQLAGGFARYSVDDHWLVPHFEKMLYDNALLLRVYTQLWRLTSDELALRVAAETAEFLRTGLGTTEGGFASSLDADTNGVEGLTYAFTPAELVEALGPEDGAWAADLFEVTGAGTFEHGRSVLRLARDIDGAAPELVARWQAVRTRLRNVRAARPQPGRDDKVVAAWAGLAVTALAEFAGLVDDPVAAADARSAAVGAATLLAELQVDQGRVRRVSRDGTAGVPRGVLDDYGCLAEAFAAVHQLTGDGGWLTRAGELLDQALAHFADGRGGFFDTADDAERLVTRPADPTDNATPSGLSSMVSALIAYAALTGESRYRDAAERAIETAAPLIGQHARFAGYLAAAAEAVLSGPYEIAIATTDPETDELVRVARRLAPPGAVVVAGPPDAAGVPLLADRPTPAGQSTAYVCRGFVCDRPVSTVLALTERLAATR
jgi:uncharacterized protein YyaL (SSP411 family)